MAGAALRRLGFALFAWICLAGGVAAQNLTFPALTGRVVDEAALLSEPDRAALTASLAALEAKTGAQFVVVTLKSLQGVEIEDYGYQLGRRWGIGQKDKNSGVLLIVAPNQRVVRIEVGYGLEGVLTDAATRTIIETAILPRFKAGDFPGGIKAGAARVIAALGGAQGADPAVDAAPAHADSPVWPVILLVIGGVVLLLICMLTPAGGICAFILRMILVMALSNRNGGSSGGGSSFSGGGGSFGGGGSTGRW